MRDFGGKKLADNITIGKVDLGGRFPLIRRYPSVLTAAERDQCRVVAQKILAEKRLLRERAFFEPFAREGVANGPFVFFGDPGEIPLLGHRTSTALEYRLSVLAGDGDLVVSGYPRNPAFEAYKHRVLQLGRCRYLAVAQTPNGAHVPTHVRCLTDETAYRALKSFIRQQGGATFVPHIATGAIWSLARRLGADTGTPVHVAGPLPSVTQFANDKLCFSQLVNAVFGESAAMTEVAAHGMAALVGHVHAAARKHRKLVIKLPSSAGSAGNFPVFSSDVVGMKPRELGDHLKGLFSDVLDPPQFPMAVQIWENQVLSSPSVQLWIPKLEDGLPVIEGVFEQKVTGDKGSFAGARPLDPSESRVAEICHGGLMLGRTLQELGYFGRCSFDSFLSGDTPDSAAIRWVECNGRWGGVSVPMTLLNRLFADGKQPPYVIAHGSSLDAARRSFSGGLEILKDLLWRPGRENGIIFLTPSGFEFGNGLHFVSLASSGAAANEQAEMVRQRLATQ